MTLYFRFKKRFNFWDQVDSKCFTETISDSRSAEGTCFCTKEQLCKEEHNLIQQLYPGFCRACKSKWFFLEVFYFAERKKRKDHAKHARNMCSFSKRHYSKPNFLYPTLSWLNSANSWLNSTSSIHNPMHDKAFIFNPSSVFGSLW